MCRPDYPNRMVGRRFCFCYGSKESVTFHPGDRIAQLVIQRYVEATFIEAETLPGSDRAERGFGSTGVAS